MKKSKFQKRIHPFEFDFERTLFDQSTYPSKNLYLLKASKCFWGNIKGSNKPYRKIPLDFLRGISKKFRGICRYYFSAPPKFFHNFVSFHPILMFVTILESGDKTNNIGDEFKTIRLILINT